MFGTKIEVEGNGTHVSPLSGSNVGCGENTLLFIRLVVLAGELRRLPYCICFTDAAEAAAMAAGL